MAYPVNPNVYNGGAVVLNSAPFANFFMQQQAKRQAKADALDKYYNDQATALTPTGMRAKDIEGGWSQKYNQWQKLGIENRKALLNPASDNYKTVNEFNRLANELKTDVQRSKEFAEMEKQLREAKMSGKWNPTDDDFEIADDIGKSIYDGNRKGFTLDQLSLNVPPLDVAKFNASIIGQAKRNKEIVGSPIYDSKKGVQTLITQERFGADQLRSIAETAGAMADSDRSAKVFFQHALESDDLPNLQKAYSSVYGNDIVDSPAKAAKAFAIMQNAAPTGVSEEIKNWDDPDRKLRDAKSLAAFNSGLRKEEERLKEAAKGKSEQEQQNSLDKFISGIERRANESPTVWTVTDKTGKEEKFKQVPLSPTIAKTFEKLDIYGDKVQPDALGINADGEYVPIFYKKEAKRDPETKEVTSWEFKKGKTGAGYEWDETLSKPIPKSVFKAELANALLTPKMVGENLGDEGESKKKKSVSNAVGKTFNLSKGSLDDL
jgi:hypothetical protein